MKTKYNQSRAGSDLAKSTRKQDGNMLILVTAVTVGIVIAILVFMVGYVRLMGTQTERKTAIESAALTAAREMSRIVIENNDFGMVGLSDSAPIGTDTQAADNFYTAVHGINTILGTTLLDYIIADTLGDTELRNLADQDFTKARAAADQLTAALSASVAPGGSGVDKDGNNVTPYAAAEAAYQRAQVRMAGASSYQAGSLQLSLGSVSGGLSTNIPTPTGWGGSFPSSVTIANHYRSYVPVTHGGKTWVFAGIGDSVKLVDVKKWVASASGLPWQHPTIVRAEALHNVNNNGSNQQLKTVACAQPASVFDPKPAPGALVISFPDGIPDGTCSMNRITDLYGPCLSDSDDASDMYYSSGGDYPTDTGTTVVADNTGWPFAYDTLQTGANACKIAVYDWYKRAGTKASVSAVVNMHSTAFGQPTPLNVAWPPGVGTKIQIPNGVAQIFRFDPSGNVTLQSKVITPSPYYVISDRQTLFEAFEVLTHGASTDMTLEPVNLGPPINDPDGKLTLTTKYDLYIRDFGRRPGKLAGGKHAGEPMEDDPFVSFDSSKINIAQGANFGHAKFDSISYGAKGAKRRSGGNPGQPGGSGPGSGAGALPMILPQEDFAFFWNGTSMEILKDPAVYKQYPTGSGKRLTYQKNGVVADIRFRRQVHVEDQETSTIPMTDPVTGDPAVDPVTGDPVTTTTTSTTVSNTGYIGIK